MPLTLVVLWNACVRADLPVSTQSTVSLPCIVSICKSHTWHSKRFHIDSFSTGDGNDINLHSAIISKVSEISSAFCLYIRQSSYSSRAHKLPFYCFTGCLGKCRMCVVWVSAFIPLKFIFISNNIAEILIKSHDIAKQILSIASKTLVRCESELQRRFFRLCKC